MLKQLHFIPLLLFLESNKNKKQLKINMNHIPYLLSLYINLNFTKKHVIWPFITMTVFIIIKRVIFFIELTESRSNMNIEYTVNPKFYY